MPLISLVDCTCAQHDAGVAGVGAAGDGRDHHGAVPEGVLSAVAEGEGARRGELGRSQAVAFEAHLGEKGRF